MSVPDERTHADRKKAVYWPWLPVASLSCVVIAGVLASEIGKTGDSSGRPGAAAGLTAINADASELRSTHKFRGTTTRFPVSIRKPSGPPRVATGQTDPQGGEVTVACSTCHTIRNPNSTNKRANDLDEFHGELTFSHGNVSCLSCHNSNDYDALKLADGTRVEFEDVMTLCAQCHGPQMKDYEHNAHGGMNGFWDLSRGPRTKNNCVDCHHPHAPQFPKMQPVFKPKDRFLD